MSGESSAIACERSGRRISSTAMCFPVRMAVRPAHQEADLLARDAVGIVRRRQVTLGNHGDAVGNLEDLVEVWLMTSTAEPERARSISAWRMVAAAPASTPQVGWQTTKTPGLRSNSRPTTKFLQVAAGQRPGIWIGGALAHVESLGDAADDVAGAAEVDDHRLHEPLAGAVPRQDDVHATRACAARRHGRAAPPARRRRSACAAR